MKEYRRMKDKEYRRKTQERKNKTQDARGNRIGAKHKGRNIFVNLNTNQSLHEL